MPIFHKFLQKNWENGFETNNTILDITPYKPEVMFIGTFNPETPNANFADFFYGRNYFWPAFKNIFIHHGVTIPNRRMPQNGMPAAHNLLNPSLAEIFCLCLKLKLTFADLISQVLNNNAQFNLLPNDNVIFNNNEYNLIQDGQVGAIGGLAQLNALNQVDWNTNNVINFLCQNPQIRHIYFTRQPNGIWAQHWNLILNHECMVGRQLTNIFTPSGRPLPGPVMGNLIHHWVHNVAHGFGQLNNAWLVQHGVNPNTF